MIELSQLTFSYPGDNGQTPCRLYFDTRIESGEVTAVAGPSGAGKSTLLDLIAGFQSPASGGIKLAGQPVTHLPPAKRPVTQLFQEHNLFMHLTVYQNLALGLVPHGRLTNSQQRQLTQAARRTGIESYLQRKPSALSGGQRQRVAIARCLLRRQPVLLLDEPFSALDPALRQEMLTLVAEIAAEQQLTVLMVSHQPQDALRIASRLLFIDQGRIVADMAVSEVQAQSADQPRALQQWLDQQASE